MAPVPFRVVFTLDRVGGAEAQLHPLFCHCCSQQGELQSYSCPILATGCSYTGCCAQQWAGFFFLYLVPATPTPLFPTWCLSLAGSRCLKEHSLHHHCCCLWPSPQLLDGTGQKQSWGSPHACQLGTAAMVGGGFVFLALDPCPAPWHTLLAQGFQPHVAPFPY